MTDVKFPITLNELRLANMRLRGQACVPTETLAERVKQLAVLRAYPQAVHAGLNALCGDPSGPLEQLVDECIGALLETGRPGLLNNNEVNLVTAAIATKTEVVKLRITVG